jgi:hypothetical protein
MVSKKITRAADHKFMPATVTAALLENMLDVQGAAWRGLGPGCSNRDPGAGPSGASARLPRSTDARTGRRRGSAGHMYHVAV